MDSSSVQQQQQIAQSEQPVGHVQPIQQVQVEQSSTAKAPRKARAPTQRAPKKQAQQVQPGPTISKDDDVTGGPALKSEESSGAAGSGVAAETVEKTAAAEVEQQAATSGVPALQGGAEEQKSEQIDTASTVPPQATLAEVFAAKAIAHGSTALKATPSSGAGLASSLIGSRVSGGNFLQASHDIRKLNQERIQKINQKLTELKEQQNGAVSRLNVAIEKLAKWNKRFKTLQKN